MIKMKIFIEDIKDWYENKNYIENRINNFLDNYEIISIDNTDRIGDVVVTKVTYKENNE